MASEWSYDSDCNEGLGVKGEWNNGIQRPKYLIDNAKPLCVQCQISEDHVSKVTQPYIQMNNVQQQVMCTKEHVVHEARRRLTRVKEDEK